MSLDEIVAVLNTNKDPRKWTDLERVWPELAVQLRALINEDQGPSIDTGYVPLARELSLQPKAMTGRISFFANGNDPSTAGRSMGITGESADNPIDQWFCAMRFEYVDWIPSGNRIKPVNKDSLDMNGRIEAKKFLATRRLKITNDVSGLSIIVRPADVGPGIPTRVIDVSEEAINALEAHTDDVVRVEWVDPLLPLGIVSK